MILVHAELRRQGIGLAIMLQCMLDARLSMEKKVVGLDATPLGQSVYHTIGFQPSFRLWRCNLRTGEQAGATEGIEAITDLHLAEYTAFLKEVRFNQKLAGLELARKMKPSACWVLFSGGKITALAMSRDGRDKPFIGPLLGISPEAVGNLLKHALNYWYQLGYQDCYLDIPENQFLVAPIWENETCVSKPSDFKLGHAAAPVRVLTRMYELASDESVQKLFSLATRNEPGKRIEYQRRAKGAAKSTREHIETELAGLRYLYSTAGPELG